MGYAPLDRLVSDFASGRQGVTALVLVAVADLARRGVEEFGVGEVHEAVTRILSKLRSRPGFLEQEPAPMAMAAPLGRLSDMGVVKRVSDRPARYRLSLPLDTLYRYAGEALLILLDTIY